MAELDPNRILREIADLRAEMNNRLDALAKEIKADMNLKHQAIDFIQNDHEKRLSFSEKIMMTIGGVVLLGVLTALLKLIGI